MSSSNFCFRSSRLSSLAISSVVLSVTSASVVTFSAISVCSLLPSFSILLATVICGVSVVFSALRAVFFICFACCTITHPETTTTSSTIKEMLSRCLFFFFILAPNSDLLHPADTDCHHQPPSPLYEGFLHSLLLSWKVLDSW